jgi:hypothetical protein
MKYLVQVLLPLTGPSAPGGEAAFSRVRSELTERFGGVTAFTQSPATGLWRRSASEVERDVNILVEVVTDGLDRPWWDAYRRELEGRFAQELIHMRAVEVHVL